MWGGGIFPLLAQLKSQTSLAKHGQAQVIARVGLISLCVEQVERMREN